jgi:serine/threonine protein kinase
MSHVFLAVDLVREEMKTDEGEPLVAIKLLRTDLAKHPQARSLIESEASRMQKLAHPNIATVYTLEVQAAMAYLVMEYVPGAVLSDFLHGFPEGVPLRSAVQIISGMAAGLTYAHQKNVVHLDFKPSTCLFCPAAK